MPLMPIPVRFEVGTPARMRPPSFKPGDMVVATRDVAYAEPFIGNGIISGMIGTVVREINDKLYGVRFGGLEIAMPSDALSLCADHGEDPPSVGSDTLRARVDRSEPLRYDADSFDRLKSAASAVVAEWRKNGTSDRDELRHNLTAAVKQFEPAIEPEIMLLAKYYAEQMVHGGYTRTDTLTFTMDGLAKFLEAVK